MPAATETSIWIALRSRIESLPLSPALPVAYPASTYSPGGEAYLSIGGVTQPPDRRSVGPGSDDRIGTLGIIYVAPLGQDTAVYTQVAGLIAAHFPKDLALYHGAVTVRVMDSPHVQEGYRDGAMWHVPITIRWRSFT